MPETKKVKKEKRKKFPSDNDVEKYVNDYFIDFDESELKFSAWRLTNFVQNFLRKYK